MKALLIKKLRVYIHTHSIARLVDEVSRALQLPPGLVEKVKNLDMRYISTRCTSAWPEPPPYKHYSREDAEEALTVAVSVVELVRRGVEENPW